MKTPELNEPSKMLGIDWGLVFTVTRADLKQIAQSKDFWLPMAIIGSLFFFFIPLVLLFTIARIGEIETVSQISQALSVLPESAQQQIKGINPEGQTGYALSVFLLSPIVVIVPLTISTAIGAASIVGERERGTGEFLAHSPVDVKEIYLGKLLASLIPGYGTVIVGFGAYSLVVNTMVGHLVGGWFFPTAQWWIMILWVLPPFLALCLSLILRLSARVSSAAAAQQASGLISLPLIMIAYSQATGALFGAGMMPIIFGGIAWALAITSLLRGLSSIQRHRLLGVD